MNYDEYLIHFNPNHDPRNGQFSSGNGVHLSKRKQRKAYVEAHNRMADRFNNEEMPKLRSLHLDTEEHNRRALETMDRIFNEEYEKVIDSYINKSKNKNSNNMSVREHASNGKIIAQGILATAGATALAGIGQYAAFKSGNKDLANALSVAGAIPLAGAAVTIGRLVKNK